MAIPQKVGLRRSNVAGKIPTSDQIELGELAFNTNDKKIYFKGDDGSVIDITSSLDNNEIEIVNVQDGQVLQYNSTAGRFENVSLTTNDVSEGSDLYFTQGRARGSVSASGDISYDSLTGVFSVTTYKSADFDTDFSSKSTTDISEGTNLYFTTQRVQDSISVIGDLSYSEGVISFSETYSTPLELKTAYESNADTNAFTDGDKSKLSGIESGATADQSATEIKSLYESNADTNAFTDIEKNLLSKLEREKLLTYFL